MPSVPAVKAEKIEKNAIGIRLGISNFNEEDFLSYELFGLYGLPWYWKVGRNKNWIIQTMLSYSVGVLTQSDDSGFLATIGPVILLNHTPTGLIFDLGSGIALLSDEKIGNHDFGGSFQLTAHAGISYRVFQNIAVGYRFFHISDAGINNGKGLNRHLLELSHRF